MKKESDVPPRIARSLDTLRSQIDTDKPNRSKVSDGWIGDEAHKTRKSDHNPNPAGHVTALDVTHDIDEKRDDFDAWKFAETLRLNRDQRIEYVICNGRIFYTTGNIPWKWQRYDGKNNHALHTHVSVHDREELYDDPEIWDLTPPDVLDPAPIPPLPAGVTLDMRRRMMEHIMGYEGQFDGGNLMIFIASDGRPEIAGVTQKDHPAAYARLRALLDIGDQKRLREEVLRYYADYTAPAQNWTDQAGIEFFLRDCVLNRGPAGAAEILQMAVGVKIDREVGPITRGALTALEPAIVLGKLYAARELYEDKKYGKQFRLDRGQWQGLVNRWNKALTAAMQFQQEQASALPPQSVPLPAPSPAPVQSWWDYVKSFFK